jgi:co-chaperonin GroES (HSP10)
MHNHNTIHLNPRPLEVDLDAAKVIECPSLGDWGIVVVEMLPEESEYRGILLIGEYRPDVGRVIAMSGDVKGLSIGDYVGLNPYAGQWVEGFAIPGYSTTNQVRFLGRRSETQGEVFLMPLADSIAVTVNPDTKEVRAALTNIIIDRDPAVKSQHGILIPDTAQFYEGMCTVVSVGPLVQLDYHGDPIKEGDRVYYHHQGLLQVGLAGHDNWAVVPQEAIWMRVT